jgi:hypothetical protein
VSTLSTGGRGAAGITAQSIGAGGGSSTTGAASSGSPNLGGTTGTALGLTFSLGTQAGVGGTGGTVSVSSGAGSSITTAGSGSPGILAQSIGGGGGLAGGGSTAGSGDNLDVNFTLGASGGSGNFGGPVTVANAGLISTGRLYQLNGLTFASGGDSAGILAQSIGGGGGVAGSSDAAASLSPAGQVEGLLNAPANSYSANVTIGGSGGSGASGGSVQVTNSGTISTLGIRAYGIAAQSIGGGGGSGGGATSAANSLLGGGSTTQNEAGKVSSIGNTYAATVSVAGSGNAAGNGGAVAIANTGGIFTAGYSAHTILAQSIGGGGGVGAEGTVNNTATLGLGAGYSGSGGAAGNGGNVTINNTSALLATLGDDAYAILAQSIGGGGGAAGAGCSNSNAASVQGVSSTRCFGNGNVGVGASTAPWNDSSSYTLTVGGSSGASGYSGTVSVTENGTIITTGARSFGIVAQSIAGGGGIAAANAVNIAATNLQNYPGRNTGNSYPVTVTLGSSASITTSGAGAWGILAQSIGGGGGFEGDASLALQFPVSNTLPALNASSTMNSQYPDADTVTVNVAGNINTTGANAHGVFAQSVGGGGGIAAGCCHSASATLVAGNTAQIYGIGGENYSGIGRAVTVTQYAGSTIKTSGPGSIGIIAQSTGNATYTTPIDVTIGGTVIGGTNIGYSGGVGATGILLSGGASASSGSANTISVNGGGSVNTIDGVNGTAIITDYGLTNVTNDGTITGSIRLGTTPGTVANAGTLDTGSMIVASSLTNAGKINVFGPGTIGTTSLSGSYIQTGGGTLQVDVDSLATQPADLLQVGGTATIGGLIVPVATALLPGTLIVVAASTLTSTATAQSSLVFNWSLATTGTSLSLSPASNFTPAGVPLTGSEQSLASYLTKAWLNADPQFASLFGRLSQITAASAYTQTLDALSATATQAQAYALANSAGSILGAAMSCPVFVDQSVLLGEDDCVYAKITGQQVNSWASGDTPGYDVVSATYQLGGQHEIAPDWFLGGMLAAGQTWATASGGSSGYGHTFDGSVAVKHTMGPWLFAGSIALATGAFHSNRLIDLSAVGTTPAVNALLQSDPSLFLAAGRLRGAYEFTFNQWYIRPYGDLDLVYTNAPSFQESGAAVYALNVRSSSKTSVVISPMVELGGRVSLDGTTTLRPYAAVGVSFLPDSTRYVDASFVGALPADGTFRSFTKVPSVLGDFDIGLQLYHVGGFEVKAQYNLRTGGAFFSQSGSARIAYHF